MRDADDRRTGSAYLVRDGHCDHLREASSLFVLVIFSMIIEGLITSAAYGAAWIGVGVTLRLGYARFGMGQRQEFLEVCETTKGVTLGAKQTCTRGVDGENDDGTRSHITPMVRPRECGKNQLRGLVSDSAVIVPNRLTMVCPEKRREYELTLRLRWVRQPSTGAAVAPQERDARTSCAFAREPSRSLACSWLVHILLERVSCMKPCVCVT
jgi:hypothetical protein